MKFFGGNVNWYLLLGFVCVIGLLVFGKLLLFRFIKIWIFMSFGLLGFVKLLVLRLLNLILVIVLGLFVFIGGVKGSVIDVLGLLLILIKLILLFLVKLIIGLGVICLKFVFWIILIG